MNLRDAAETRLRQISNDSEGDLPKVIRGAFHAAAMLRDEGLAKEAETAVEVLVDEGATCSSAPPAIGYLRGRAQAKRDEAPNAPNPAELENQAELLEQAATILEG